MVESKLKLWVLLPVTLSVSLLVIIIILSVNGFADTDMPIFFKTFFLAFLIYFFTAMMFGEIRTKAIKVYIDSNQIIKKGFIGLGPRQIFFYDDIEGYKLSNISSKAGTYEYLYIIVNSRKVIKLSEYYHKNYKELKRALLNQNVKYLGFEYWSFVRETKEIFL